MSITRRRPDIDTRFENPFDLGSLFDHIIFHQSIVIKGVNTSHQIAHMPTKSLFFRVACSRRRMDGSEVIKRDRHVIRTKPKSKIFKFKFEGFCWCRRKLFLETQCVFIVKEYSEVFDVSDCCGKTQCHLFIWNADEFFQLKIHHCTGSNVWFSESIHKCISRKHLDVACVLAEQIMRSRKQRNSAPRRNVGSSS